VLELNAGIVGGEAVLVLLLTDDSVEGASGDSEMTIVPNTVVPSRTNCLIGRIPESIRSVSRSIPGVHIRETLRAEHELSDSEGGLDASNR
jgi:hypothetical protein